jgi:CSLREA domain-containing protein
VVHAAAITVNTTADELSTNGNCSLREAIQAANTDAAVDACTAGSGDDVITLPAGTYTLLLTGAGENANATGDLDILNNLTIDGAGAASTITPPPRGAWCSWPRYWPRWPGQACRPW